MIKYLSEIQQKVINKGLNTNKNFFSLQPGQSPSCLDIDFNRDNSFSKRLGTSSMNSVALETTGGYGMYDVGLDVAGVDTATKLLLQCNGANGLQNFLDSSTFTKTITSGGAAQVDTSTKKFGTGALRLNLLDTSTVLLLHCDGADASTTFTDSATTPKTVTAQGNAQIDTAQSKFGGASGLFDGTGDYLTTPDHADFYFGTGNFTIDFWVRFSDLTSRKYFCSQRVDAQNFWLIDKTSTVDGNKLRIAFVENNVGKGNYIMTNDWSGVATNTWYHLQFSRNGTGALIFINGVSQSLTETAAFSNNDVGDLTADLQIGAFNGDGIPGWLDEFRISKGVCRNTSNFTPSDVAYYSNDSLKAGDSDDWNLGTDNYTIDTQLYLNDFLAGTSGRNIVWQMVNTANYWSLYRRSSAIYFQAVSQATTLISGSWSIVSMNTSTWFHLGLTHSGSNFTVYYNGSAAGVYANTAGIPNFSAPLEIGKGDTSLAIHCYKGYIDELRLSKGVVRYTADFTPPVSEYSGTIEQQRRLFCASGTGIYYSTDVGRTWVIAQTSRSAVVNNFALVKSYVLNMNNDYQTPQYWTGTIGTYFKDISTAAPLCKYSLTHQGYLIMLNEQTNRRSMYYVPEATMFSEAFSSFAFPTDKNDELTGGFVLNNFMYASTKYKLFRLIYVGGNPDWSYYAIKDWGFVPKTMKKIQIPRVGQVVIGLDWSKNIRIFDGKDDEIISQDIKFDNGITPFYMDNLNDNALPYAWGENDTKAGVYRLYVGYGTSNTTSHCINYDYQAGALSVHSNRNFQSGVLASDTANILHMLACDYQGYIHHIDSGNTDSGTAINEYYISPLLYKVSPKIVSKGQQIDAFFSKTSSGTLYWEDRTQFSDVFALRQSFSLGSAISSIQIRQTIDVPETFNVYQYRLSSSANTADRWQLNELSFSEQDFGIGKP